MWKQLLCEDSKPALRERREASMARKMQSEAALRTKRSERKHAEEKQTLRAQMAVDDTNRQILYDLKAEEKEREEVGAMCCGASTVRHDVSDLRFAVWLAERFVRVVSDDARSAHLQGRRGIGVRQQPRARHGSS